MLDRYQSGHGSDCNYTECTEIRDIVFRNLTFLHSGGTGNIVCFPNRPCQNITFDNVHVGSPDFPVTSGWGCAGVASGTFTDVTPPRDTTGDCNFTMTDVFV